MRAADRRGDAWFRTHFDTAVLTTVLVGLLVSGMTLLLRIRTEVDQIKQALHRRPVRMNPAEPLDFTKRRALNTPLASPFQGAQVTDRRLMTSEVRVMCVNLGCVSPIPFHSERCPFCWTEQPPVKEFPDRDGGGIPDEWEERHQLDAFNGADERQDADGDLFTNLEEYLAETDPRDPDSLPPPGVKLRLVRILHRPFDRVFTARMETEEEVRFQLNARSGRTYFLRIGDEVLGYTIEAHIPDDPAGEVLLLRRGSEELRLVRGRAVAAGGAAAVLLSLSDGAWFRVRPGGRLEVKGYPYRVLELAADGVRLEDGKTGDRVEVPRVTRAELEALRERLGRSQAEAPGSTPRPKASLEDPVGRPWPGLAQTRMLHRI